MPGGKPGSIWRMRSLTRSITSTAFSPWRITTIPDTTSPVPSRSATPRRRSGPTVTSPMSRIRIGVPLSLADTTMLSKSATDFAYPRPRTMYSVPPNSMSRPPVSTLPPRTASTTRCIERP